MTEKDVTVIMPALNEEKNILAAIENILQSFKDYKIEGEVIVVNDGSTDGTAEIVKERMLKNNEQGVRLINHQKPCGIGASFWDGIAQARGKIVTMFPGDNENDPWEAFRYYKLLEHVDIVVPFVFNRELRPLFRNVLSLIYRFIINATFIVNFHYTNGTILYRKSILDELSHRSNGFFFQTDILIRTVKKGYLFAEVPYRLGVRMSGISKAISFPSLLQVIKGYLALVGDFYFKKNIKSATRFSQDSSTAKRWKNKQDAD